ncbi:hypothetical protein [Bdellovibrio sp. HCB-110]|uniref:hypothetical protein n=1 Tax=Bdellovibrio sp. HCB-110 TaxID=3391182 RepID=UPI0039B5B9FA
MFKQKILKFAFAVATIATLTACDPNAKIIKDTKVKVSPDTGDITFNWTTHLDSNNIQIWGASFPILNPHNRAETLGQLAVSTTTPGITDVSLDLYFTDVINLPSLTPERTLPNGTAFPILAGVSPNNWFSIPLGESGSSKLYVNVDMASKKALVGYVLSSDSLRAGVVANLFTLFKSNGITGVGGIYSGTAAGQSGFAIFADLSNALPLASPNLKQQRTPVQFGDLSSKKKQDAIAKRLMKLNLNNSVLRLK